MTRDDAVDLAVVLENVADVIIRYAADGTVLWASPSLMDVFGYDPDDVVGSRLQLATGSDFEQARAQMLQLVQEHVDVGSVRYRACHADGTTRWVDARIRIVWDANGSISSTVSTMRDVTREVEDHALLRATLDSQIDPHLRLTAVRDEDDAVIDLMFVDANPAACAYLGVTAENLLGRRAANDWAGDSADAFQQWCMTVIATGEPLVIDGALLTSAMTGRPTRFDVRAVKVADSVSLTWRDSTEHYATIAELREAVRQARLSERQFRLAMESSPIGLAVVDLGRHIRQANQALLRLLDCDPDWLIGRRIADLLNPADAELDERMRERALADPHRHEVAEKRLVRPDGREAWVEHSIGVVRDEDGAPTSFVSQFVDIDAAHAARELLKYQATHDSLTRLVNRHELRTLLAGALTRSTDPADRVGVLYLDLDNLKAVNDTFGHGVGDALLVEVASRISRQVRGTDIVARVGGDEFVVVLPTLHTIDDAEVIAAKILQTFVVPCRVAGHTVQSSISIGVTIACLGEDPAATLARADDALYAAKNAGKARSVTYDADLHARGSHPSRER